MKSSLILGTVAALVAVAPAAAAKSPAEIEQIAKAVSVAYNQAIPLDPKDAVAYYNRGNLKSERNDPQGALADYNQAIFLNPKYAEAYGNRGFLKDKKLKDRQGAIGDLRTAARIFREQGRTQDVQKAISILRQLGATEKP